jgi:polar amino acid transport system substrate-binding protein
MSLRGRISLLAAVTLIATACTSGATPAPTQAPTTAPTPPPSTTESMAPTEAPTEAPATPIAGGLLDRIMKAGKLVVSTDPQYPPQSELMPDGTYQGFDIDVATEIARRLGVQVDWQTPAWDAIIAGNWGGRWDVSVGSMTITVDRSKVLDFSPPYYYTPAQMAASTHSGITTLDGLAGKTVCSGQGTTYDAWLNGTLDYGTGQDLGSPPAGVKTVTLKTDRNCAEQWKSNRFDFDGWLSSITTVDQAISDGLPLIKVGDPVFYEPLAVAVDKSGADDTDFMPVLGQIVADMHADGFLTQASMKWFGADYTQEAAP